MNYLPSLEERRLKIIENCCSGCDSDGMSSDGDPGYESGDVPTMLDKAINKVKSRRKKKEKGDGT